ncbi:thiosulfate sulfurtransferase 18-like [Panicum miliaceum]|uniref:Thiosulfate sulfurtransferase 18-like n=1 Tax=Panicum miliaceum TaxID=4540 RepID=A0A3L6RQD4_PANMI|nr:thiosulfate sulfurtransferase 18-like [Panicum miliaceum]
MAPPHQTENSAPAPATATATTVDMTAARHLIAAAGGHRYLDVRTEEELSKLGHLVEVDRSINVPYMFITPEGKQQFHYFTTFSGCQSGKRSEQACVDLQAAGFKNVKNMGGGYLAWLHHGFPVHHRPPPRQEDA